MSSRNYEDKSYNSSSSSNTICLGICWEGARVALSRCNHKQVFRVCFVVRIKLSCLPAVLSTTLPLRMLYSSRRCSHSLTLAMVLETKQDRKCTYIVTLGCILDSSQMVIPFNPLGLHFLLFTVVQIFWNVVAVTGSIIMFLCITCFLYLCIDITYVEFVRHT